MFCILLIIVTCNSIYSQDKDIQLAEEYFKGGEYQKAILIYQKLVKDEDISRIVHDDYLNSMLALNQLDEAEKFIKKQIKTFPQVSTFKIDYAIILERQQRSSDAEKIILKTINDLKSDPDKIDDFAQTLLEKNKAEFAEKAYLEARSVSKNKILFSYPLAQTYAYENKIDLMIEEFLNLAVETKNNEIDNIKNSLQENITKEEDYDKLEKILISKLQKTPSETVYNDLLMWYYLQQKEFYKAFVQARAIDKRSKLEGSKLMEIGLIAINNKDYKNASIIFEFLTKEYPNSHIYPIAKRYLINAKEELVKSTYPIDLLQINSLITDYKTLISEIGANNRSMEAMRSMAILYGFFLDKKDSAAVLLEQAIKIAGNDQNFKGKCKIDLGDIYLLRNEPWESTLLYSQVEKELKDQPLGYEAKLRNAKLSYYKGDFQLAKDHLDVLKLATSREIANDAMDLSLLISDNLLYDSTGEALKEYANVDLLLFQNKNKEAMSKLQIMINKYEKNSLIDEIYWLRANLYVKSGEPEKAINDLDKIVNGTNYYTDILRDDAYFLIAKLTEEKLGKKEQAMEMYRNYMEKFPGTIYISEVRKRYRALRGDKLN